FEDVLPRRAHGNHYACRLAAQKDGCGTQAFRGLLGPVADAQAGPRLLEVGAYQQRLSAANHILCESILQFAAPLGQDQIVLDLQLETDFVTRLECDVEIAVVEN